MAANETYELVVRKALETVRPGPWNVVHLVGLEWVIDDAFCAPFGSNCGAAAVNEWLRSLSTEGRDGLIGRLNGSLLGAHVGVE